jgi:hypothetical protein
VLQLAIAELSRQKVQRIIGHSTGLQVRYNGYVSERRRLEGGVLFIDSPKMVRFSQAKNVRRKLKFKGSRDCHSGRHALYFLDT